MIVLSMTSYGKTWPNHDNKGRLTWVIVWNIFYVTKFIGTWEQTTTNLLEENTTMLTENIGANCLSNVGKGKGFLCNFYVIAL